MHGLINRALQCYVRDTHGPAIWAHVTREARLGFDNFEPMLSYDIALTEAAVQACVTVLRRPRESILEDLGTFLVSNPELDALRRLLRFGGVSFTDFLQTLEETRGRGRLALADLDLPELDLVEISPQLFKLQCRFPLAGSSHVMMGLLRAMADDYGALVLMEHGGNGPEGELILIQVLEMAHSEGRRFYLTTRVGNE
ncbi:heme NO-binding domain-containing protein [Pseudorhodobacter sp.]|uniref:heme NO-binding domain-containing protein n=1 Tax=Pseudorhodobacter sp. TaxID=1934400 RepID=UPI00264A17DF|nr:heme NO-binding domain-containing protein [Pseudorhodobacter sp.]MDN5788768.1 heme NO-binding domain-containing protein [Pseudorhodobacter sp.]